MLHRLSSLVDRTRMVACIRPGCHNTAMKAVVQRVNEAWVEIDAQRTAAIGPGLACLVGIERSDTLTQVRWMADKIVNLRIFQDDAGRMNRSVIDTGNEVLLVPNFTIAGDARKGRRPSFDNAMAPDDAKPMFIELAKLVQSAGATLQTGIFGAHMHVGLINDGPVTIVLAND